jgi:hypothetical protein
MSLMHQVLPFLSICLIIILSRFRWIVNSLSDIIVIPFILFYLFQTLGLEKESKTGKWEMENKFYIGEGLGSAKPKSAQSVTNLIMVQLV